MFRSLKKQIDPIEIVLDIIKNAEFKIHCQQKGIKFTEAIAALAILVLFKQQYNNYSSNANMLNSIHESNLCTFDANENSLDVLIRLIACPSMIKSHEKNIGIAVGGMIFFSLLLLIWGLLIPNVNEFIIVDTNKMLLKELLNPNEYRRVTMWCKYLNINPANRVFTFKTQLLECKKTNELEFNQKLGF